MPKYFFIAKSPDGQEKTGQVEAKDAYELAKHLKGEGFTLVSSKLVQKKESILSISIFGGVPLTDKLMFSRNLRVMVSSGLSLPRALNTLASQTKNKKFSNALISIKEEVTKGKAFSECLESRPDIFSELFCNMIKVGEESGTMEQSLNILAVQMEREHELKEKIKNALVYPAVIITAMIGIGILMLVMVVPKLADTFEELEVELPLTTRIVIGLGEFMANNWILSILIVAGFLFLSFILLKQKRVKKVLDALFLKIPVVSSLVKKTNSAQMVRTLSSLIASGVPIVKALKIVSGTLGNFYYKKSLDEAAEVVKKGGKLSVALEKYRNLYPPIVFQMVEVGEETGETSGILEKLAEFFEEEITNATKNLAAIVEPIIMLVIGAAIGFFAISMVQPMYSMLGAM